MKQLPKFLNYNPDNFYNNKINERELMSEFIRDNISDSFEELLMEYTEQNLNQYSDLCAMFIGGGRSWENSLYCFYDRVLKIISSGNYDVYLLCNEPRIYELLVCRFKDLLIKYINNFNKNNNLHVLKYYTRNISKKGCQVNDNTTEMCTLFPCNSLSVYIESYINTSKRGSNVVPEKGTFEYSSVTSSNNSIVFNEDKLLFYIEFVKMPNLDIPLFKTLLLFNHCNTNNIPLDLYYLNPRGLLLFSQFITKGRKDKGINIDLYRNTIIKELIASDNKNNGVVIAYKNILDTYNNLFKSTIYYDVYYIPNLVYKIHLESFPEYQDFIDYEIMKLLVSYINSFILNLSIELSNAFDDQVFIKFVGGYAINRYIPNTVKDIDTKIFISSTFYKSHTKMNALKKLLIQHLCHFCIFMEYLKNTIFKGIIEYNNSIIILLLSNVQFLTRLINESSEFPITLFSIDYFYNINIDGVLINKTLPILDIVLVENVEKYSKDDYDIGKGLFVSKEFLIKDLTKIYTKYELASGRFWNQKKQKDYNRFIELNQNQSLDHLGNASFPLVDSNIWIQYNQDFINALAHEYYNIFSKYKKLIKIKPKIKIKLNPLHVDEIH